MNILMQHNRTKLFETIENQYKLGSTNEIYMHPGVCIDMLAVMLKEKNYI
ncbi:MAG: hypothetical protein U0U66_12035 [Cytophagaceae bacterium]